MIFYLALAIDFMYNDEGIEQYSHIVVHPDALCSQEFGSDIEKHNNNKFIILKEKHNQK